MAVRSEGPSLLSSRRRSVVAEFKIDAAALRELLAGPNGPVWDDIRKRGNRVLIQARANAPYDEGILQRSLTMEMVVERGVPVARVGSNLKYAIYVHEGTGLYGKNKRYIRPVRAKVLRWPVVNNAYRQTGGPRRYKAGRTANYTYSMKSRGYPGRPFLRDALTAAIY